ncbi:MAG: hypothetical protein QW320_06665 [Ignisphaera sp.]|uniref:hypothetical protein n=1 Tax=Thermofilum sp. TaxID=1961369 RepID=UPI0031698A54
MPKLKRIQVDYEGEKYTLRELTFSELGDVMKKSARVRLAGDDYQLELDVHAMQEMLLEKCIEYPKLSMQEIRDLPAGLSITLLNECLKLTPVMSFARSK